MTDDLTTLALLVRSGRVKRRPGPATELTVRVDRRVKELSQRGADTIRPNKKRRRK